MPDIEALIRYIRERRIEDGEGSGYSFVKELPPNIRDTFFAMSCLKMLKAASPDRRIVRFLSSYSHFDLNSAYYAMKCLKLAKSTVCFQNGMLSWRYKGDEQVKPCTIPTTPLTNYLKYNLYGMYGSSIFSSSMSTVLKRIELGEPNLNRGLVNSVHAHLISNSRQDIMSTYMDLEILRAISMWGYATLLPPRTIRQIKDFLKSCTTHKGYVGSLTSNSVTLESTYAGHKIAKYLGIPGPLGISFFIDSLQNENGGFRRSPFCGISTLESCYLAMSVIFDSEEIESVQRREVEEYVL